MFSPAALSSLVYFNLRIFFSSFSCAAKLADMVACDNINVTQNRTTVTRLRLQDPLSPQSVSHGILLFFKAVWEICNCTTRSMHRAAWCAQAPAITPQLNPSRASFAAAATIEIDFNYETFCLCACLIGNLIYWREIHQSLWLEKKFSLCGWWKTG